MPMKVYTCIYIELCRQLLEIVEARVSLLLCCVPVHTLHYEDIRKLFDLTT